MTNEVFTAVTMKGTVSWDVSPCSQLLPSLSYAQQGDSSCIVSGSVVESLQCSLDGRVSMLKWGTGVQIQRELTLLRLQAIEIYTQPSVRKKTEYKITIFNSNKDITTL
jgi:spore coat protein U-like protein